jgi:uncharacterized phage infection (PIP) family protein YhgE
MVKERKKQNVNIEILKSLSSITEMLYNFKDILSSLVDMAMKQNADTKVMNERWKQIRESIENINDNLNDIKVKVNQIVVQWDYKERTAALSKRKINWNKIFKNPFIIIFIIIILGIILVIHGAITGEQFWESIEKLLFFGR